jgi:uncharacterized Zn-finger protein
MVKFNQKQLKCLLFAKVKLKPQQNVPFTSTEIKMETPLDLSVNTVKQHADQTDSRLLRPFGLSCWLNQMVLSKTPNENYLNKFKPKPMIEKYQKTRVICFICYKNLFESSMRNHLKLHELKTSEKKFECNKCPKKFYTKQNLKQHENTHYKPKRCHLCESRFSRKRLLSNHLFNRHGIVQTPWIM